MNNENTKTNNAVCANPEVIKGTYECPWVNVGFACDSPTHYCIHCVLQQELWRVTVIGYSTEGDWNAGKNSVAMEEYFTFDEHIKYEAEHIVNRFRQLHPEAKYCEYKLKLIPCKWSKEVVNNSVENLKKQWIFELYGFKGISPLAIDEGIITENEIYDLEYEAFETIIKHIMNDDYDPMYYMNPFGEE